MRHSIVLGGKDYELYNDEGKVILSGEGDKRCFYFGRSKVARLEAGAYMAGILKGLQLREEAVVTCPQCGNKFLALS